jgi:hypothetical protein
MREAARLARIDDLFVIAHIARGLREHHRPMHLLILYHERSRLHLRSAGREAILLLEIGNGPSGTLEF